MSHVSTINPPPSLSLHAPRLNGCFHRLENYNQIARHFLLTLGEEKIVGNLYLQRS